MNKVFGKKGDFTPVREDASRVVISYGFEEADSKNATWYEIYIYKKQVPGVSYADVKAAIIADINERTREKIIGGFTWDDKPVWLSEENQLNFSTAIAPVNLKIGEQADGTPVYHDFETAKQLANFWKDCQAWKQQCLTDGWAEKDSIDWSQYQVLFPGSTESTTTEATGTEATGTSAE